MSTNNNNNDDEGKPKDDWSPTPADLKAAELCTKMDYDDALLALQKDLVPDIQQYPPDATEKQKRDIDETNALAVNTYGLKITVDNLREDVGGLDVAPAAAPAAAPTDAPTDRLQQLFAQADEDDAAFLAEIQAQYDSARRDITALQESDANQNEQIAVLTETAAQQGERLSTVEERLDRADAERSPPRRNPPRGKKGKGGKKQK